jgi:hypothetical protein
VVKRAATISDDYSNSQQGAGSKRSVMDRLGHQLSNKRCVCFCFCVVVFVEQYSASQFLGGECYCLYLLLCRQRGDSSLTSLGSNGVKGNSLTLLH